MIYIDDRKYLCCKPTIKSGPDGWIPVKTKNVKIEYTRNSHDNGFWANLPDDIIKWFDDNNINYIWKSYYDELIIFFIEGEYNALIFKLIWGGK